MWYKKQQLYIHVIAHLQWIIYHQSVNKVVHGVKKNGHRYCENLVHPRGTKTLNTLHYSNTLTNITFCLMLLSWELIISATLWLINVPERWASILWALNRVASLAMLEDESRCKNRWKGNSVRAIWIPKHTEYLSICLNYLDVNELQQMLFKIW